MAELIDCPTPGKEKYRTKKIARQALARMRRMPASRPGRLDWYRCPCGFFHLGHLPPSVISGETTRADVLTSRRSVAT